MYLNHKTHAQALCASGELPDRPHKYACLRKLGVAEYQLTQEILQMCNGTSNTAEVSTKAEIDADTYETVRDDMLTHSRLDHPRDFVEPPRKKTKGSSSTASTAEPPAPKKS